MTAKVVALQVKPGIQRDGTQFAAPTYVDGRWVRFQNGLPRKMGGYRGIFLNGTAISRGMTMTSTNGLNYVLSGYSSGLEQWSTDNDDGIGFGPTQYTMTGFTSNANNLWQFDIGYDFTGGGINNVIAHPGQNLTNIDSTTNTPVLYGQFPGTSLSPVGVFTAVGTTVSGSPNVTFASVNVAMGAGLTVTGTGIPTNTTIVSADLISRNFALAGVAVTGTAGQFSCSATTLTSGQQIIVTGSLTGTATGISPGTYYIITTNGTTTFTLSKSSGGTAIVTTAGTTDGLTFDAQVASIWTIVLSNNATISGTPTLTFDANISVSGGVVMLHPYLFVYGNYGLIQNCAAGNFNDWVSADANANNVSTGKVVKGLPLRGGTTSPAGLFWTLDSVVRVTYAPSTVNGINYYWKYDLITSQSSIMSSQCVIEYDGIFYWCGVDRFLSYNGVVQEIPNNQNMNYFFDNLNYAQRQKVWCTKVPRWGEVWWFYPKGDATECTDAIIYNVREKSWYDAGQAVGARRSAGTFSEVFRKPIWAGNVENTAGGYTLWQHETGTDQVFTNQVNAIDSYFETPALGSYAGLVGSTQQAGDNLWTRCERIEPDFVQSGQMSVVVIGKGYADDIDQESQPYTFESDTLKIDMREQRREMRLRFRSSVANGDYFMGKVLLSLDTGDVRSTGNP
jgi:hypothetical protein